MNPDQIKLDPEWKLALAEEFEKPYMQELRAFLGQEASKGKEIYPRGADIFNAFNHTPLSKVRVVILGQDPYHGPGQAHGLCFSVKEGVRPPPSLVNVFKEIHSDLGIPIPVKGDLTSWADQGVLLLNTVLTVEHGLAASHRNRGWEKFTDRVIQLLSEREEPIVFLLWGKFAHDKARMIRVPPHKILTAPHPSPLSAYAGYFGSKHFSKTNEILKDLGNPPIDWSL
jgi:uracil-DNA glycosylase